MLRGKESTNLLLTAGGVQGMKQGEKHIILHIEERVNMAKKRELCSAGFIILPDDQESTMDPSTKRQIKFENKIGLGTDCNQFHLKLSGFNSVTGHQQAKAMKSREFKQCQETTADMAQMRQEVDRITALEKWKLPIIQKRLQKISVKNYKSCMKHWEQLNVLDKVSLQIEHNLPFANNIWHRLGMFSGKYSSLWRDIINIPYGPEVSVGMQFNAPLNSVVMTLSTADQNATFENIQLPTILTNLLPWSAANAPGEQLFQKLTGTSIYETCWLADGSVTTFGQQSYLYSVDNCYHILVGDCSEELRHAVLLREIDGQKHLRVFYGQTEILLRPRHSLIENNLDYQITVDGKEVILGQHEVEFPLKDGWSKVIISRSVY
jgi:hypothetical protein